ncbi:glutaredoxin-C9-like [Juglans microcarpa x Juglans regia]|uniref:glutaredoxin-C9-like n=1 Tax=Juglans microcarpa x Juglans regia TaxID=2249226 RepID=UPI001B7E87A4|nr:glutaredoxin-C9-like [Juglans microcarpa x Juglans regia]
MHQAIPYSHRTYFPTTDGLSRHPRDTPTTSSNGGGSEAEDATNVGKTVSENAVMVVGRRGCCMCHVVKRLLQGLGVNPPVFEVDEKDEVAVTSQLLRIMGAVEDGQDGQVQFPVVFVGGKLFGGLERVMATHISGELVPILKQAGALWL